MIERNVENVADDEWSRRNLDSFDKDDKLVMDFGWRKEISTEQSF